jgi:hypothetical protein
VAVQEGVRLPSRTTARNGDAYAAVVFDAKQIAACPAMAHEVDGGDGFCVRRDVAGIDDARKRKPQLHGDRIPDSHDALDRALPTSVIFIALVRGT